LSTDHELKGVSIRVIAIIHEGIDAWTRNTDAALNAQTGRDVRILIQFESKLQSLWNEFIPWRIAGMQILQVKLHWCVGIVARQRSHQCHCHVPCEL
jgi:hypothetical protein